MVRERLDEAAALDRGLSTALAGGLMLSELRLDVGGGGRALAGCGGSSSSSVASAQLFGWIGMPAIVDDDAAGLLPRPLLAEAGPAALESTFFFLLLLDALPGAATVDPSTSTSVDELEAAAAAAAAVSSDSLFALRFLAGDAAGAADPEAAAEAELAAPSAAALVSARDSAGGECASRATATAVAGSSLTLAGCCAD